MSKNVVGIKIVLVKHRKTRQIGGRSLPGGATIFWIEIELRSGAYENIFWETNPYFNVSS